MPNVLITGAASGLGKAFVTAYLRIPHTSVLAVDKTFSSSTTPAQQHDILEAAAAYRLDVGNDETNTLRLFTVDVRDETQITTQLSDVGDVDVVVHSAGVRGLESSVPVQKGEDVARAESLDVIGKETMMDTFCINTVGTFVLIRALLPKLRAGGGSRSQVVVMGSRMGSMGSNTTGGGYAYRASKAAVNAVVKSFSIDVPEVVFAVVHPGRVESGLVAVKEDGAISAEESVRDVLGLIGRLGKEDSGRFFDRFGREVPW